MADGTAEVKQEKGEHLNLKIVAQVPGGGCLAVSFPLSVSLSFFVSLLMRTRHLIRAREGLHGRAGWRGGVLQDQEEYAVRQDV